MKVQTKTKRMFGYELKTFESLLTIGEDFCNNFSVMLLRYSLDNAYGNLHFFLARGLRLTRNSYELAMKGKYTEALIVIRAVMESSLLARYFALDPKEIQKWGEIKLKIREEKDKKIKNNLIDEYKKLYNPSPIRRKIAGPQQKELGKDLNSIYEALSDHVHPPLPNVGEFIIESKDNLDITLNPSFNKILFVGWFKAASWSLANALRIFYILYDKKQFKHLGKTFLINFKKIAELISELMDSLDYMETKLKS